MKIWLCMIKINKIPKTMSYQLHLVTSLVFVFFTLFFLFIIYCGYKFEVNIMC